MSGYGFGNGTKDWTQPQLVKGNAWGAGERVFKCQCCGEDIKLTNYWDKPRAFCNRACKQKAYRLRKSQAKKGKGKRVTSAAGVKRNAGRKAVAK